jgi:hypothetical protein
MTRPEHRAQLACYELRVHGRLGPLLLSALPHAVAARVPEQSLLLTVEADDQDILDILGVLAATGLEVESVRSSVEPGLLTP